MIDHYRCRAVLEGSLTGLVMENYDADLFQNFLSQVETVFHTEGCRIIKDFGHTKTAVVTLDLGNGRESFFLKKSGNKGFVRRALQAFRQSKASRAWAVSLRFLEKGIPVIEPVAFVETKQNGLKGESYLLSVFERDAVNLKAHVNKIGVSFLEDGRLLVRLGDVIGRMHRAGCIHGDLKWSNLMVTDPADDPRPLLVDLEHGRCRSVTSDSACAKDLARFMVDVHEAGLGADLSQTFLQTYFDAAGIADGKRKNFRQQMNRVARKIVKRHEKTRSNQGVGDSNHAP
ncbi:MAG: lipopolysaccharide kinase InaA family protein [bacterium]|nr:lipopolysaccharide kinase InaA family protein [bacterium]